MKISEQEEVPWIAGLLEGEGSFGWQSNGQGSGTPRVSLRMCDEDVVTKAAEIISRWIGKFIAVTERERQRVNWSPGFDFTLTGDSARFVMKKIIRFMSEHRKHQIITALEGKRLIKKLDLHSLGLGRVQAPLVPPQEEPVMQ